MAHYFKNTGKQGAVDEQLFVAKGVQNALLPAKGALAGESGTVV